MFMKTRKQVDEEYSNFISDNKDVTNLNDFLQELQTAIADCDEQIVSLEKDIRKNNLLKLEANIRNFFFFIFEQEEVEFYDEDNELLERFISLYKLFKSIFESILYIARDYNYERLSRFCDFLCIFYNEHLEYIDYLRDKLEYTYNSAYYNNPEYEDNSRVMIQFYYDNMIEFEKEFDKREGLENAECIELRKMKAKWGK